MSIPGPVGMQRLFHIGARPKGFGACLKAGIARWAKSIRDAGTSSNDNARSRGRCRRTMR